VNVGVSVLVVAEHRSRRAAALQVRIYAMVAVRVLTLPGPTAGGLGAVQKVAAWNPTPSSPALASERSHSSTGGSVSAQINRASV
jgi:hypothetical protein